MMMMTFAQFVVALWAAFNIHATGGADIKHTAEKDEGVILVRRFQDNADIVANGRVTRGVEVDNEDLEAKDADAGTDADVPSFKVSEQDSTTTVPEGGIKDLAQMVVQNTTKAKWGTSSGRRRGGRRRRQRRRFSVTYTDDCTADFMHGMHCCGIVFNNLGATCKNAVEFDIDKEVKTRQGCTTVAGIGQLSLLCAFELKQKCTFAKVQSYMTQSAYDAGCANNMKCAGDFMDKKRDYCYDKAKDYKWPWNGGGKALIAENDSESTGAAPAALDEALSGKRSC